MKSLLPALVLSAIMHSFAVAQEPGPPVTSPPGPTIDLPVVVLPPPPNQVGDPSVQTGGPGTLVLTNRGHIISDPVNTDDLMIDVTLVFPTFEVLPNNETYRDYIDIVIATTGNIGLQQNRPWGVLEPHTVIVRVFQTSIHVVEVGPPGPDGNPTQTSVGNTPINTGEGGLPLHVQVLIHEGVIDVQTGGNGGAGGDPLIVDLPTGTNGDGNVIIYNRETVAGVTFEAEVIDLTVNGTPSTPVAP